MFLYKFVLIIQFTIYSVTEDICNSKNTCAQCIEELDCIWCSNINLALQTENQLNHCIEKKNIHQNWCMDTIVDPKSNIIILKNDETLQINPQSVRLNLRMNEEYAIKFIYRQKIGYPIDLYFLVDSSNTMKTVREHLIFLSKTLVDTLNALSNKFQVGLGTFVDKNLLPFANEEESIAFINYMSLRKTTSEIFSSKMKNIKTFPNNDDPEGILEAAVQAIVCRKEIGWRKNSRHILTILTDDIYHIAGDSKLAGILEPNDGLCHLKNHSYTHDTLQDYPSIEHINKLAEDNNVYILFIIDQHKGNISDTFINMIQSVKNSKLEEFHRIDYEYVINLVNAKCEDIIKNKIKNKNSNNDHYENIANLYETICKNFEEKFTLMYANKTFENITNFINTTFNDMKLNIKNEYNYGVHIGNIMEILSNDISEHIRNNTFKNIVDLITSTYKEIIDNVKIEDNFDSNFEIKYESSCNGIKKELTNICKIHLEDPVEFTAKIKLVRCPDDKIYTKNYKIKPVGLRDGLEVAISMNCECPCENPNNSGFELNSTKCNFQGNFTCGLCNCNKGKYGAECQCKGEDDENSDVSQCELNGKICSNKGKCICNKCSCDALNYRKYCECNDYVCPTRDGEFCSGPNHGSCKCNRCVCSAKWTGSACECHKDACLHEHKICSNHGKCECEQCKCDDKYTGIYCEECITCCSDYQDCIDCLVFRNETDDCSHCSNYTINTVDHIEKDLLNNYKHCEYFDNYTCSVLYSYFENDLGELTFFVEISKHCQIKKAAVISIPLIVFIILAGLIGCLVWKIAIYTYDKREYNKFQRELDIQKWIELNPLFKSPISRFPNPMYRKYPDIDEQNGPILFDDS